MDVDEEESAMNGQRTSETSKRAKDKQAFGGTTSSSSATAVGDGGDDKSKKKGMNGVKKEPKEESGTGEEGEEEKGGDKSEDAGAAVEEDDNVSENNEDRDATFPALAWITAFFFWKGDFWPFRLSNTLSLCTHLVLHLSRLCTLFNLQSPTSLFRFCKAHFYTILSLKHFSHNLWCLPFIGMGTS